MGWGRGEGVVFEPGGGGGGGCDERCVGEEGGEGAFAEDESADTGAGVIHTEEVEDAEGGTETGELSTKLQSGRRLELATDAHGFTRIF